MEVAGDRLLLVEDDDRICRQLVMAFAETPFAIDVCNSLSEARTRALTNYALVLLDLGLPDGYGLDLCRESRAADFKTPIIVLTARDSPSERVHGLEAGADDYICKPFHFPELIARVRAVLRRGGAFDPRARLARGRLWLDPDSLTAGIDENSIELKRREFQLLHFLMRHPGRTWTRAQLLARVWGPDFECERWISMSDVCAQPSKRIRNSQGTFTRCGASDTDSQRKDDMQAGKLIRVHWWNRLGFRVGLLVAGCIVIGDLVSVPAYIWVDTHFHPDDPRPWTLSEVFAYFGLTLAYASTVGLILGLIVARFSMPRLRAIASQAAGATNDELPGPFQQTGRDEITQMAQALNSMRERVIALVNRLQDREERRNEWIVQVSHDLRTPLTALISSLDYTSMLLDKAEDVDKNLRENHAAALIDARRVQALSDDLLEIARLEIDQPIREEAVWIGELLDHAVRGLQPLLKDAGVEVRTKIDPALSPISADGRLLLRAIENLLMNSIQHTREWIQVSVLQNSRWTQIHVEDNGAGFEQQEGEVSFQELKMQRSRPDSAGLGLMVVQRVAAAHGGRIEARNRTSGGAEVQVILPTKSPDSM